MRTAFTQLMYYQTANVSTQHVAAKLQGLNTGFMSALSMRARGKLQEQPSIATFCR